jgi:hypothetical protein
MAQHRSTSRKIPAKRWIWLSALGVLLVIGVIGNLTSHPVKKAAVATATSPHVHPVVASAAPSATASPARTDPASTSVASRVIAWNSGPGRTGLNRLHSRLVDVTGQAQAEDVAGLGRACVKLAAAVTAAQADPPIPDPAAQRWYTRALAQFGKAAADCQAGTDSQDVTMIDKSGTALTAGAGDLANATTAIRALAAG